MDNQQDVSPLPIRLGVECSAAIVSAFLIAPAISIIDKAIVSNASGKENLVPCIINGVKTFITKPIRFLKQPAFLMIWGVYGGTYVVANCIESICERSKTSPIIPKFVGSSSANVTLSVFKDRAYARMFGVGSTVKVFPAISYGMFASRDSMTILASFTLPGVVGKAIDKHFSLGKQTADNLAQLTVPCIMQFISSPLHLYGLDRYNRAGSAITSSDRIAFIKREYLKTASARIARIFPAFGIGGIVNKYLRKSGKKWLFGQYSLIKRTSG